MFGAAGRWIGIVLQAVLAVEAGLQARANGASKKQIALTLVDAGLKIAGEQMTPANRDVVAGTIDTIVKKLNDTGVFAHAGGTN